MEIHVTNLFKCFFSDPPSVLSEGEDVTIFLRQFCLEKWVKILKKELDGIENNVPIITFDQPVMKLLCNGECPGLRFFWGYFHRGGYTRIDPERTKLNRAIYPYPHLLQRVGKFYVDNMTEYGNFMQNIGKNNKIQ